MLTGARPRAETESEHRGLFQAALAGDEHRALALTAAHLGRTAVSSLGEEALALLIERIRHAQGISVPVLEGLTSLT